MWEKVGKLRNPFKLDLPRSLAQYLVFPGLANTTNTFVPGGLRGPCLMRLYLERHRFFFFFVEILRPIGRAFAKASSSSTRHSFCIPFWMIPSKQTWSTESEMLPGWT